MFFSTTHKSADFWCVVFWLPITKTLRRLESRDINAQQKLKKKTFLCLNRHGIFWVLHKAFIKRQNREI